MRAAITGVLAVFCISAAAPAKHTPDHFLAAVEVSEYGKTILEFGTRKTREPKQTGVNIQFKHRYKDRPVVIACESGSSGTGLSH